jgi:hypothetical protein
VLATVAVSDVFRKLFHAGAVLGAQYMLAARSVDRNQSKNRGKTVLYFFVGHSAACRSYAGAAACVKQMWQALLLLQQLLLCKEHRWRQQQQQQQQQQIRHL